MLYIISNDNNNSYLKNKITAFKNKVSIKDINVDSITYKIIDYKSSNKKQLFNFLNTVPDDYIYISKEILDDKLMAHEKQIMYIDYTVECIQFLLKKGINRNLFFVVSSYKDIEFLIKVVNFVKNVFVVTENQTLFDEIYDLCYDGFGISIVQKEFNYKINDAIILNLNSIKINVGINNTIFLKNYNFNLNNRIIHNFKPMLSKKYLKFMPKDIDEVELFTLLNHCYLDKFNKNMEIFICAINNDYTRLYDVYM